MPTSAKILSSFFRSGHKISISTKPSLLTSSAATKDFPLKQFVTSLDAPPPPPSASVPKCSVKPAKRRTFHATKHAIKLSLPTSELETETDESTIQLSTQICSMLSDDTSVSLPDTRGKENEKLLEEVLEIPWIYTRSHNKVSRHRREIWHERKRKWIFSKGHTRRFDRIIKICANQLGTEATIEVFGKLGQETGVKEYNSLIGICLEKARACDNEDVAIEEISKALQVFNFMKEKGFQLKEETYGPILMYFIEMGMIEEFHFFCKFIDNENRRAVPRLCYYEMLLWIKVNDEEKIRELCNRIAANDQGDYFCFQENYLLALCESDHKDYLLQLLETIDITKISSLDHVASIFKSLGRLLLESYAEKYLLGFKMSDPGAENVSNLIFGYITGIPNLEVDDVVIKFKEMHAKLEITPSSASYEKLITFCCDLCKVHVALDIVDQMFEGGFAPSIDTVNSILLATEESCEFNLVRRIYSLIRYHNLKPNSETFRSMISLSVKMKDFDGAYGMLDDLKDMGLMPTTSMYNAIMAGYFRKKDVQGALMVLKQMGLANVKPDSQTFGHLIHNCSSEEDIIKYYEKLKCSGVQVTKYVFMTLINAYANCGEFEKAKQVILEQEIPLKSLSEMKSVLVAALASHGQVSDALRICEEIKQTGCGLEPRAAIALIDCLDSEGELSKLIQILEELHDPDYWIDGCCRLILRSIRFKNLSYAMDLLKQLKDKVKNDEIAMECHFTEIFCQIAETDLPDVQIGLDLLQFIKHEFGLTPSRKCLDFLLGACVNARDLQSSRLVWKEYEKAGLPYNILSYLWMYKAFLASGDLRSASKLLSQIPKEDPHVRSIIQACKQTYIKMYKAFLASGDPRSASKLLSQIPKEDPHVRSVIQACRQTYIKSAPLCGKKSRRLK